MKLGSMAVKLGAGAAAILTAAKVRQRITLSQAKHRSLSGHVRMAKRAAGLIPAYAFGEEEFFTADGAPEDIALARKAAMDALSELYHTRFAKTATLTADASGSIADIDFTTTYRVPFQFSPLVKQYLPATTFFEHAQGVQLRDLDGNSYYDLTGSYGVNLLGVDAYRQMMAEGGALVDSFGPTLAGLHPLTAENAERLKAHSGLDAVSFHMSGTEAVMQAVRLARYHTGRPKLVRFAGAYHGWWGDVQPGVGNPVPADRTYTLADMSEKTLKVLRTRKDIACVLVNPLQSMHPNKNAPGDSTLVNKRGHTGVDRASYSAWLGKLQAVCREAGIVLIMDEVFTGFRLARGGACEYFRVEPDLVTYGKTLGGGYPVGVLCGRADLMKRYNPEKPADICFARGTFNSHPYVIGAMNAFLRHIESDEGAALYDGLDARWNARAESLNAKIAAEGHPVEIGNLSTIFTVRYTNASRYHWMLQFYLKKHGLALSWVGTGRFIFSLAYTDADFAEVESRFLTACRDMRDGGWWWTGGDDAAHGKAIRKRLTREMLKHTFG
ncbi:aminotransferase class III-fold pyridoxal phosphate-dependent enzyme [Erythrobacter sp. EC-HK427]|uniref:aminotransferase class III-fold pyridoxal phosphate-dependent enzyme n=1 Tax=Erythrobacter sp. EC-HK427 TaxID=2038396 RepID=UPI001F35FA52|nr:aminotransferase class III-fold pyridoxal phosphate-dependent enzyme [Erythrobacter sp. EC-HK427]